MVLHIYTTDSAILKMHKLKCHNAKYGDQEPEEGKKKENLKEMREVLFRACLFWADAKSSLLFILLC